MTTSTSFAQMANKQSLSLSSALRANTPPTKGQTTSRKFLTLSIFFLLSFFCTTHTWAAEGDVVYALSCVQNKSNSAYASYYDVTINSKKWNAPGNQTLGDYWRIGGGKGTSVSRYITGKSTIDKPIKKITVSHKGKSNSNLTVNSFSVIVAKDANFSNIVETKTISSPSVTNAGSFDLSPTNSVWETGCYYKFTIVYTHNKSSNYGLDLTSIVFYEGVTAPSHTVTATSNNNTYGTVSVSGTTITASPKTGYTYANPAYTVTTGTATVTQNGNTFAVTPSTNCTIRINFEAIPSHKVYFNTGGLNEITPVDVTEGSTYNITQTPTGLTNECEYNTFAGWTTSSTSLNNATECPEIITSIMMGTDDITLYAVYSKTETTQGSGTEVTIIPNGLSNNTISHNQSSYTITTAKNGGQTAPAYNAKDADVRIYAKGSITISNTTNITKIVFNVSTQGKKRLAPITASVGSIATQASGDGTVTWTGEAKSVTFTVGDKAEYGSEGNTKAGQLCFTTITATTSGGGSSSTTYYHSTPDCGTPAPTPLNAPSNLRETITCAGVSLAWDAISGASKYEYTLNGTSKQIDKSSTSVYISPVTAGKTYTWTVKAIGDGMTYSNSPDAADRTFTSYYSVTYNLNGGSWNPECENSCAVGGTFEICSTEPSKDGCNFVGWSTADDTEAEYQAGGTINNVSANTTLYAQWTAKTITITWNANDGSVNSTTTSTYTYNGTPVELPIPTRANYTFNGWFTAASGGTQVTEVGTTNKPTEDVIYYAQWTANTYIITFYTNDGTINDGNMSSYTYGVGATLPTDVTKTGYTFDGWYNNSELTGSPVTAIGNNETGDKEFWAKWTPLPQYTVTLVPGSGSVTDTELQETSAGAGVTLPTPTLDCGDWEFAGWKTTSAVTTETTTEPTLIPAGNYKPTSNITLYAVYSKTEITQGGGGSTIVTLTNEEIAAAYVGSGDNKTTAYGNHTIVSSSGTWGGCITIGNENSVKYVGISANAENRHIASPTFSANINNITIRGRHNASKTRNIYICSSNSTAQPNSGDIGKSSIASSGVLNQYTNWTDVSIPVSGDNKKFYVYADGGLQIHSIVVTLSGGGSTTTTTYNSNPECGPQKLATPNVELTYNCSSATITWDAVTNADHYWYQIIKTGDTKSGESSAKTTYTRDNLYPGTSYTWSVQAIGDGTNYTNSEIATGTFTVYSIQWLANNELVENACGKAGEAIVVPSNNPASCDDAKEFVGWTATPIDGSTDTEPNDLFTTSPGNITGNATYYAVFATQSTGSGSSGYKYIGDDKLLTIGKNYIFVSSKTSGAAFALKASDLPNTGQGTKGTAVAVIVETGAEEVWVKNANSDLEFEAVELGEDYTLRIVSDNAKYLYINGSGVGYRDASRAYYDHTGLYGWNNDGNKWYDVYYDNTTQKFIQKEEASSRVYAYEKSVSMSTSYSGYMTTCCKQPKTPLTIKADQTELVKSGVVTLTATGGNGTNITWAATGGELSNQSNTGATLTISDVDATQNITVTATQAENNNDDEVVYCAQEASIDITVKAQWTITFWTNDDGNKESNSMTVTDGESYTMPDISDEYICTTGHSFVGWVDNEDDTELDATPNSTQTATADQTWYAAWITTNNYTIQTRDKYELITKSSEPIAENDVVIITYAKGGVALGQMTEYDTYGSPVAVDFSDDKSYLTFAPGTAVMPLKVFWYDDTDDSFDGWAFEDYNHPGYYIKYSGKGGALSYSQGYLWMWNIVISNQNNATISDVEDGYTEFNLQYNSTNPRFAFYSSSQNKVQLYRKNGTIDFQIPSAPTYTTNNTSCTRGAVISAENGKWITSSKGQKVRIAINVTARGFNSNATLSATSANEHFSVASITNTAITQNSAFETQMMIEYQPAEANTNENAEITLVAKNGEEVVATRTIDVNGRSLPDEFVIVAQYGDKWLALPANMQSGADQYNGIEVTPNNALTQIPAAPSTTIYSLRGVADNRYETAGNCVRLVGNGNKCLWGNVAKANTTIQNWTTLGATNGKNYEWLLTTSDGELYTIANPAHTDYNQGRILSNLGAKYGLYKETTKFYILPVGCSSQPGNIQVTARRVDATFSWEGSASSVKIDVYTNDAMAEVNISNTATASPYYMTGLSESTQYWFKMTPNGTDNACAYTGTFKTTGPTIDVVEWQENAAVIFVDKDEKQNPLVIIDGEVEHGVGTGSQATELFFSKYFEAHAENKLLAIFNGTTATIDLTGYTIKSENGTLDLSQFGQTKGEIAPNEEIILVYFDAKNSAESCAKQQDNYETWNVLNDKSVLAFSGRGSIGLYKNNVLIDVIGSTFPSGELTKIGKSESPDNCGTANDVRLYVDGFSVNDQSSFFCSNGDNIKTPEVEDDYAISTNRCLLIRKNSVTSGANAVATNKADAGATCGDLSTTFTTLCSEWSGFRIGGGKSSNEEIKDATCDGLGYVGGFDYNQYYKEYTNIDNDIYLEDYTHDDDTKEYIIPIENLAKYSCLNIRFQLKKDDQVLTEEPVQVPIIVSGEKATNDAIFNAIVKTDASEPEYEQSIERCKTCNVVVLSDATLTKAANDATNDVAEVYNMKVYPGGQVVVPAETNYTVNSLAFRRQEDEVSMANIQGKLTVKHANGVYLDVRIDPSNWHYMTLPYDCRVGDVTFADGTPAVVNTDYLLGWYDGAYRAEHKTGGWTYITDNDYILKKGLGYIVALPGNGQVRREIRFPMANDVIAEDLTGKTVSGLYAYGGDKTDAELRPNHKGWNMIGSPYLYTYTTDIVKEPLQMGTLEHSPVSPWDGTWVRTGDARYIVEPIDNGWSGYRQTTISNLKPFTSYFIQVGGVLENGEYTTITPETAQQIVFAANSVARNASAPRKVAEAGVTDNHPVWYGVEMIAPNNEKDNTTLLISDEFTDGYDMMDDLVKMRGDYYQYYNFPVLASNNNEGEMAFNALPDSSAAKIGVPLSYYAATAGTYTIATDGRFDLEEVKAAMLYDATTAQYTNLLTDNYSFTTNKGNNTNRFTLFVTVERKKVPNITTGMDNLLANGQLSLIAVERTLVLSGLTENADIYVYDMSGKMVTGTHSAGENGIWRTTVPATGVYFVRVNTANSQQTLRTIVK